MFSDGDNFLVGARTASFIGLADRYPWMVSDRSFAAAMVRFVADFVLQKS